MKMYALTDCFYGSNVKIHIWKKKLYFNLFWWARKNTQMCISFLVFYWWLQIRSIQLIQFPTRLDETFFFHFLTQKKHLVHWGIYDRTETEVSLALLNLLKLTIALTKDSMKCPLNVLITTSPPSSRYCS